MRLGMGSLGLPFGDSCKVEEMKERWSRQWEGKSYPQIWRIYISKMSSVIMVSCCCSSSGSWSKSDEEEMNPREIRILRRSVDMME